MIPIQPAATKTEEEQSRIGFGTTPAFDSFLKTLGTYGRREQSIILCVNLATLVRNEMVNTPSPSNFADTKKIVDAKKTVTNAKRDMGEIANEFGQVVTTYWPNQEHHILYYLTNPEKQVPPEYLKPRTTKSLVDLDQCVKLFCQSVKNGDQKVGKVTAHVRLADKMVVPSYVGIAEAVKALTRSDSKIHLISHEPLDYHVAEYSGRSGLLFRSHTGIVVPLDPAQLGKVVFKCDDIPFYRATHILLGDHSSVKGVLGKKERDMLAKQAKEGHWNIRGQEFVKARIKEYNFSLPYGLR